MNKKSTSSDMLTKNDVEMALDENSGLTDKHRAQILADVYRESVEALKDMCIALQASGLSIPDWSKEVIEKYPKEE